jgi:spermidine/putrescine transport system permease protein
LAATEAETTETTRRPGEETRPGAGGPRYPPWLVLPAVTWYVLFFLVPLGFIAVTSFGEVSGFSDIAYTWTLDNYRYLWDDFFGEFHLYRDIFFETFKLSIVGTLSTLVIGFPLAYYIARYAKHKTLLLLLVIVPFWTSFLIRAYAWLIVLDPEFPLYRALGIDGFVASQGILFSEKAIYIGVAYNYLPLMVLPLYAALERMDWSLVEAAQDLGDSPLRAFRRITLPLALPGVLAGSLLVFIPLTGEYIIPVILGGNKTFYAGNLIAQQFLESRDWPLGSAIAMLVIAALTVALLIYARALGRQEQYGG